ncbi:hypothetical protein FQA39_LY12170 [Lamprigera yunnana]|nr:hypothetical protein FQA39_LY12170 [Lamprigera yunnana]
MEEIKMEDEYLTYVALENVQFNNLSFEVAHQEQINELCRTCLSSSASFQSLFETDLDKMVMGFTSVQFIQGDGLPTKICSDCVFQIKQAYIFKQQVEHSDNILKQHCLYIEREQNADKPKNKHLKVDYQQSTNLTSFKTECVPSINTWLDSNEEIIHYISDDGCYNDVGNENVDRTESNESSNTIEAEENTFRKEENLKRNDEMKNASAEDHECTTCGKKSTCESALKVHMRSHIDRPYKCHVTNCDKAFMRPNLLNTHLRKHIGVKMEHITKSRNHVCSVCGKAFYGALAFTTHMRSHTQKPYQCEYTNCGKNFDTASDGILHNGFI